MIMEKIETGSVSILEIGLKSGIGICFMLIIYFFIMKSFNFMGSEVAWSFNFIILLVGMLFTFLYYRTRTKPNIDYLPGLSLGCTVTAASVIPFVLFVYGYFSKIDPALLLSLK